MKIKELIEELNKYDIEQEIYEVRVTPYGEITIAIRAMPNKKHDKIKPEIISIFPQGEITDES